MLNQSETGLAIFDNFSIDQNLPKYKKLWEERDHNSGGKGVEGGSFISFNNIDGMTSVPMGVDIGGNGVTSMLIQRDNRQHTIIYPDKTGWLQMKKDNWLNRLKIIWKFLISKDFKRDIPPTKITVQEYFRTIKMSCEEIQKVDERMTGYATALKHAEDFGQKALAEDLKSRIDVIMFESRMFGMGLNKVITEEQVVDFYKDSEKGVQLIWIRNFTRIIPESLLSIKKRADELEIFDNYVVMHYDPHKKSYKETKAEYEAKKAAEEAKRRDPIIFGVLKDSRKLYYIGSWEDEYCDLTLDKFIEKFGDEAITKNNITVNKY